MASRGSSARKIDIVGQQTCCATRFSLILPEGLTSLTGRVERAASLLAYCAEEPNEATARSALAALTESDEPFDLRILARFLDAAQAASWGVEGGCREKQ